MGHRHQRANAQTTRHNLELLHCDPKRAYILPQWVSKEHIPVAVANHDGRLDRPLQACCGG